MDLHHTFLLRKEMCSIMEKPILHLFSNVFSTLLVQYLGWLLFAEGLSKLCVLNNLLHAFSVPWWYGYFWFSRLYIICLRKLLLQARILSNYSWRDDSVFKSTGFFQRPQLRFCIPTWLLKTICNSSAMGSDGLLVSQASRWHIDTHANIYTHKILKVEKIEEN